MPEGPEVRCISSSLHNTLCGSNLLSFDVGERSKKIAGIEHLSLPLRLSTITCKGKKSIWIFEHLGGELYMTSTLGLTGRFTWIQANNTHITLRFLLPSGEERILYYDDSLKYGNVVIYNDPAAVIKALKSIGPDLLTYAIDLANEVSIFGEEITAESYLKVVRGKRIQGKQVCNFLMEQKYFSGVGNYLKAEILYRCKFHPNRTLGSLSDYDVETLRIVSLETIYEAYCCNGLTIQNYWDPDGIAGTFPVAVYRRDVDPEGRKVIKEKFTDGRTTHWCPDVQV